MLGQTGTVIAQTKQKLYKVAFISRGTMRSGNRFWTALHEGLRDRGWIEGKNILVEKRHIEGESERLPALAEEVTRLKPDVIIATGLSIAQAMADQTRTIPIVFVGVSDPVGYGLVRSLGRPGANVTGFTTGGVLVEKRMELLKDAFPKLTRVAVLYDAADSADGSNPDLASTARGLGLSLLTLGIKTPGDIEPAFKAINAAQAGALLVPSPPRLYLDRLRIIKLAMQYRIPAIYELEEWVEDGGLMSFGHNYVAAFRDAASYVDRILRGAQTASLPVVQPTRFLLVVNLITAASMGLALPSAFLARADRVIE